LQLIAVEIEEIVSGGEGGALVALKEGMVARHAEQQRNGKSHDIALAIVPVIDRACESAFQAGQIAQ